MSTGLEVTRLGKANRSTRGSAPCVMDDQLGQAVLESIEVVRNQSNKVLELINIDGHLWTSWDWSVGKEFPKLNWWRQNVGIQ